jgi:hypothetical protein
VDASLRIRLSGFINPTNPPPPPLLFRFFARCSYLVLPRDKAPLFLINLALPLYGNSPATPVPRLPLHYSIISSNCFPTTIQVIVVRQPLFYYGIAPLFFICPAMVRVTLIMFLYSRISVNSYITGLSGA